jgi:tungstate transport system ATP-binding protein
MTRRILFHGISHRYENNPVLSSVSLSLEKGKAVLLAGPNGSGKTTLMRILSGLMAPDKGRVAVDDHILTWRQSRRLLLDNTVYLHQEPYMFDASVERNLSFPLRAKHDVAPRGSIDEALHMARLTRQARQSAKSLSGGERRRLAIARAWLTGAGFMLLDEPTVNLDVAARAGTIELMRELHDAGVGLIISCHTPQDVAAFVDETVQLSETGDPPLESGHEENARPSGIS